MRLCLYSLELGEYLSEDGRSGGDLIDEGKDRTVNALSSHSRHLQLTN